MTVRILGMCIAALCTFGCVAEAQRRDTVVGGALYLNRLGVETHRAEFDYAADCELVAKIMNSAEPLVDWHCH